MRILPLGRRTLAIPFTLRHLPLPYCLRKRARSRTPVPAAMVSISVISLTISKSIAGHHAKQSGEIQASSLTPALTRPPPRLNLRAALLRVGLSGRFGGAEPLSYFFGSYISCTFPNGSLKDQ